MQKAVTLVPFCILLTELKGKFALWYFIISEEQAKKNLQRELPDYDLQALVKKGRQVWNEALGDIQVEGGAESDKQILYTSLYRVFERPVCISEDGHYYSAFDWKDT